MGNPINTVSFTPPADGIAIATATYSCQQVGTSSDWGGSDPGTVMKLVRSSDSAVLATGPFFPASRTRMPQVYRTTFTILASNGACHVDLDGQGGAPGTSIDYWDIDMTVELVKR